MNWFRMGSHVAFTSWIVRSSHLILVAIILSSVSRVLIALSQCILISLSLWAWSGFPMTHLHLSAHMRCATLDRRICRRWLTPCILCHWWGLSPSSRFSCRSWFGGVIEPHPRIVPMLMTGHRSCSCGHRSSVRDHISLRGVAWQLVSMCSIDSVVPHIVQNSRCSFSGICHQYLPTFWVPCIALYRNCLTCICRVWCPISDHIVSFVSNIPL